MLFLANNPTTARPDWVMSDPINQDCLMSRALSVHFCQYWLGCQSAFTTYSKGRQAGQGTGPHLRERIRIDGDSSKTAVRRGCMRWKDVHLLCNYSQYYHKYTNHIKSINIEVRSDCKNNII